MIKKDIVVGLTDGLEARPIAVFVQIAGSYESAVTVVHNERKVNAKSIMGMMSMAVAKGETLTVIVEGSDEEKAMESLEKYLSGKE